MTIYKAYKKYICVNCKNKHEDLCDIRRRYDGTLYCCNYIKDKEIKGYKKPESRTAKYEKTLMGLVSSNWY